MPIIIICVVMVIAAILFYLFFQYSAGAALEEEGKHWYDRKGGTMISRAPMVSYKIPGVPKEEKQVFSSRVVIGRQEGSDIVLKHNTVSKKHAEITLHYKKNHRVFKLKNLSKVNPVLQVELDDNGKVKRKTEILKSVILQTNQNNYFKFGDVDINIYFPAVSGNKTSTDNSCSRQKQQEISYEKAKHRRGTRRMM